MAERLTHLPNKGQNSKRGGQEVEDNMFLSIHPLATLKLTQSLIQNLVFGSGSIRKSFHILKTSLKATSRLQIYTDLLQ
jgi:hypothetical protein